MQSAVYTQFECFQSCKLLKVSQRFWTSANFKLSICDLCSAHHTVISQLMCHHCFFSRYWEIIFGFRKTQRVSLLTEPAYTNHNISGFKFESSTATYLKLEIILTFFYEGILVAILSVAKGNTAPNVGGTTLIGNKAASPQIMMWNGENRKRICLFLSFSFILKRNYPHTHSVSEVSVMITPRQLIVVCLFSSFQASYKYDGISLRVMGLHAA